jgi:hypothetical protein
MAALRFSLPVFLELVSTIHGFSRVESESNLKTKLKKQYVGLDFINNS